MDYNEILELLPDWVAGKLDPTRAAVIEREVQSSKALRREADALRAYYAALKSVPPEQAREGFIEKVHARIEERRGLRGLARAIFLPLQWKVPLELAGVGVTLLLVVVIWNPFAPRTEPGSAPVGVPQPVYTPEPPPSASAPLAQAPAAPSAKAERLARTEARPKAAPRRAEPSKAGVGLASVSKDQDEKKYSRSAAREVREEPEQQYAAAPVAASGAVAPASRPAASSQYAPEPAPSAPPQVAMADAEEAKAKSAAPLEGELALQRRKLRSANEAAAVMTLAISKRSIDGGNVVDDRRTRNDVSGEAGAADKAGEQPVFHSKAEKAFGQVEQAISRFGGTFTVRTTQLGSKAERVYRVAMPREKFEEFRTALRAMGKIKDIDLNLDTSTEIEVAFRLGVTVE
jgi:hypothetical protein